MAGSQGGLWAAVSQKRGKETDRDRDGPLSMAPDVGMGKTDARKPLERRSKKDEGRMSEAPGSHRGKHVVHSARHRKPGAA